MDELSEHAGLSRPGPKPVLTPREILRAAKLARERHCSDLQPQPGLTPRETIQAANLARERHYRDHQPDLLPKPDLTPREIIQAAKLATERHYRSLQQEPGSFHREVAQRAELATEQPSRQEPESSGDAQAAVAPVPEVSVSCGAARNAVPDTRSPVSVAFSDEFLAQQRAARVQMRLTCKARFSVFNPIILENEQHPRNKDIPKDIVVSVFKPALSGLMPARKSTSVSLVGVGIESAGYLEDGVLRMNPRDVVGALRDKFYWFSSKGDLAAAQKQSFQLALQNGFIFLTHKPFEEDGRLMEMKSLMTLVCRSAADACVDNGIMCLRPTDDAIWKDDRYELCIVADEGFTEAFDSLRMLVIIMLLCLSEKSLCAIPINISPLILLPMFTNIQNMSCELFLQHILKDLSPETHEGLDDFVCADFSGGNVQSHAFIKSDAIHGRIKMQNGSMVTVKVADGKPWQIKNFIVSLYEGMRKKLRWVLGAVTPIFEASGCLSADIDERVDKFYYDTILKDLVAIPVNDRAMVASDSHKYIYASGFQTTLVLSTLFKFDYTPLKKRSLEDITWGSWTPSMIGYREHQRQMAKSAAEKISRLTDPPPVPKVVEPPAPIAVAVPVQPHPFRLVKSPIIMADECEVDRDLIKKLVTVYCREGNAKCVADEYSATITLEGIQRLSGVTWLSSDVITFFLEWWCAQTGVHSACSRPTPEYDTRRYIASTFLYERLYNDTKEYTYQPVKRWFPGVKIFSLDMFIIPINETKSHWYVAVIDFRNKTIETLDSLYGDRTIVYTILRRWLCDRHLKEFNGQPLDIDSWTNKEHTEGEIIPWQRNGSDCGVFSCLFAACRSVDLPLDFDQAHIPQIRKWIAQVIYNIGKDQGHVDVSHVKVRARGAAAAAEAAAV